MDSRQQGFTMLEVMVALAIFSLVAIALLQTITSNVRTINMLDEKQLAGWVGDNRLSLAILEKRSFQASAVQGEEQMNGKVFYWREMGQPSPQEGLWINRVEVRTNASQLTPVSSVDVWVRAGSHASTPH
ncbi:type II secretion system protein GspI [Buttiauxella warmboldiae]|uniref:Type II secretion system protein I n=1 Tax=Buttiauxella warmboldiae TaxID=82993 RepID=A0A3N5DLH2_9ENTR|nr:type II secretion system minor pseudopilin GspI [Buttiauxella warmboldiae]RPH29614.1 type II secretion system protein GspI [Buttiauxella warmboldiae]